MSNRIKDFIKRHNRLYVLCKCIRSTDDPFLAKIIRGYYDPESSDDCTILLERCGERLPNKIVYDIPRGEEDVTRVGFYANMHNLLYGLKFAELINAVPRVKWGEKMPYYDHGMDKITKNAFEYYFEPISEAADYALNDFKNVVRTNRKHISLFQDMFKNSYRMADENIYMLAELYKRYIHLNERTSLFINSEINKLFDRDIRLPPPAKFWVSMSAERILT